jgi:hypothetical protein
VAYLFDHTANALISPDFRPIARNNNMSKPSKTVTEGLASGDRIAALQAVADRLASALDTPDQPSHTLAPIARELSRVLAAIEDLEQSQPDQTMAEAMAEARVKREGSGREPAEGDPPRKPLTGRG